MILIVGQSGCGKTSVRNYLEGRGFRGFEASEYVRTAVGRYGVVSVRELLEKHGKDIVARLIQEDIAMFEQHPDSVVITGFRVPDEIKYFRERYRTKVIGLYSDVLTSFRRISTQRTTRQSDPQNVEVFFREKVCDDNMLGLSEIMKLHIDTLLINEGSLDELFRKINEVLDLK